jgi:hypothetical protein
MVSGLLQLASEKMRQVTAATSPAPTAAASSLYASTDSSACNAMGRCFTPYGCDLHVAGLQCTRLPLVPREGSGREVPGREDCTATRWPVSDDGRFALLPETNSSSSSSNATDAALAAALNWLSCSAHYCCGLQVTPNSSGTLADGRSIAAAAVETSVAAFSGPDTRNTSSNNARDEQVRWVHGWLGPTYFEATADTLP